MKLVKGRSYNWVDILTATGAANVLPYYLLRVSGGNTIVAASLDITTNSRAPYEIWAGEGPQIKRWADVFDTQTVSFAAFVRETDKKHYYRGQFRRVGSTTDKHEIALRAKQANRKDIYKIIFLTEVET